MLQHQLLLDVIVDRRPYINAQLCSSIICAIMSYSMSRRNLGINILAKSYAREFLKVIDVAAKELCPGCNMKSLFDRDFERRYHIVCLDSIENKLFYCSDILPDMISESNVSDHVLGYISQLRVPIESVSLFNIAQRRILLDEPEFWETISEYAILTDTEP